MSTKSALPIASDDVVAPDLSQPVPKFDTKVISIALSLIDESPTNPRKNFGDLTELIASVRASGVLQPVLVRPKKDGRYELVYGHRRFKAAQGAGLTEIAANVRDLNDQQVLEIQLVENAQRKDIHPLEEADAYRRLHKEHKLSADEIAKKVSKSKSSVYAAMKLADLVDPGLREAFLANKLSMSVALLAARLSPELQKKAAPELLTGGHPDYDSDDVDEEEETDEDAVYPMSVRDALYYFRRELFVRLDDADFDTADASLVAKAGSCLTCPKRLTNKGTTASGPITRSDMCEDQKCFEAKTAAQRVKTLEDAKAKGVRVLTKNEIAQAFDGKYLKHNGPFAAIDDGNHEYGKTWSKLMQAAEKLGVATPAMVIAIDADGAVQKLVSVLRRPRHAEADEDLEGRDRRGEQRSHRARSSARRHPRRRARARPRLEGIEGPQRTDARRVLRARPGIQE
jgi:ParB/RepB/Spo0J family partition protein